MNDYTKDTKEKNTIFFIISDSRIRAHEEKFV